MSLTSRFGFCLALAVVATSTGCGMHAGTAPVLPASTQSTAATFAVPNAVEDAFAPDIVPPKCKGQVTTQQYASDKETLSTKGGHLCIPAFGGLGGKISYPSANPSIGITLISSTTNYNGQLPSLHSGTPIFYLQLATSAGTTFGTNVAAGGGLTGAPIDAGSTYTVYGQAKVQGFPVNFTPCYTVAKKGKFGGVIGGIGTLLKGQSVPTAATAVIEIYAGQSASGRC